MAGQLYDLAAITVARQEQIRKPYELPDMDLLPADCLGNTSLAVILQNKTVTDLKMIFEALRISLPDKKRKADLMSHLVEHIPHQFQDFLNLANQDAVNFLAKFRQNSCSDQKFNQAEVCLIRYLQRRGVLFACQADSQRVFLMPGELRTQLSLLENTAYNDQIIRHTRICNLGRNLLTYTGLMLEKDFWPYLHDLMQNFDAGQIDKPVIPTSDKNFRSSAAQIRDVFNEYVQYAADTDSGILSDADAKPFFCCHLLSDPHHIYLEQKNRPEIDYPALTCRQLLAADSPDRRIIDNLVKYLDRNHMMPQIPARNLAEETCQYLRNDENYHICVQMMLNAYNLGQIDQINAFLDYANRSFFNEIHRWALKGHRPVDLVHLDPSMSGSAKVGRNDPCPCGSGKKYKKCCGAGI